MTRRIAFLDPWSPALYQDALFRDGPLNRDNVQRPWIALKEEFERRGVECHTADLLLTGRLCGDENLYISIGQREYWPLLKTRPNVRLAAYFQLEPPVVDPAGYKALPGLIKAFEHTFTHCPDLFGGEKLYWPQVKDGLMPGVWDQPRKTVCMVNSNKHPHPDFSGSELYSKRREILKAFGDQIDLYGHGWEGWPQWKGVCPDKFEILKQYNYVVCLENQALDGYLTEKAFEAQFAGCIPIYLGAPNVNDYLGPTSFIDARYFVETQDYVRFAQLDPAPFRDGIAKYLASPKFQATFTSQAFAEQIVAAIC